MTSRLGHISAASGGSVTRNAPGNHGLSVTSKPAAERMSRYFCRSRLRLVPAPGKPARHVTLTHPPSGSPSTRKPRRPDSHSWKPPLRSALRTRAAAELTSTSNEYHGLDRRRPRPPRRRRSHRRRHPGPPARPLPGRQRRKPGDHRAGRPAAFANAQPPQRRQQKGRGKSDRVKVGPSEVDTTIRGPLRGIPLFWMPIDMSFGVVGIVPLIIAYRQVRVLEARSEPA
jgi:hypothetical protein